MSNIKRVMIYVGPVTLLSFALNIPKFMEVKFWMKVWCFVTSFDLEVTFNHTNGTNEIDMTERRRHPTYIFWYTLSQIWHPTLTTGILPFICLAYMNTKIFYEIRRNRSVSVVWRMPDCDTLVYCIRSWVADRARRDKVNVLWVSCDFAMKL